MDLDLINRVIEVRKNEELNQSQFAERLGLKRTIISLCENGKRDFSERTLKDIAIEFHVNLEWLKTGEGNMYDGETENVILNALQLEYNLDDIDIDIIQTYMKMAPLERQVFKDFIKNIADKKRGEL